MQVNTHFPLVCAVSIITIVHQQINKFSDCAEAIGSVSLLALLLLLLRCNLASVILVQIERYGKKNDA